MPSNPLVWVGVAIVVYLIYRLWPKSSGQSAVSLGNMYDGPEAGRTFRHDTGDVDEATITMPPPTKGQLRD